MENIKKSYVFIELFDLRLSDYLGWSSETIIYIHFLCTANRFDDSVTGMTGERHVAKDKIFLIYQITKVHLRHIASCLHIGMINWSISHTMRLLSADWD